MIRITVALETEIRNEKLTSMNKNVTMFEKKSIFEYRVVMMVTTLKYSSIHNHFILLEILQTLHFFRFF